MFRLWVSCRLPVQQRGKPVARRLTGLEQAQAPATALASIADTK
jgi:hypothetical protein